MGFFDITKCINGPRPTNQRDEMTTFTVYRVTNRWDRRERAIDFVRTPVLTTDDIAKAAKVRKQTEDVSSWGQPLTIHAEVIDAAGRRLSCIDMYRMVIGEETFARQEADPDFRINLDDFFLAL